MRGAQSQTSGWDLDRAWMQLPTGWKKLLENERQQAYWSGLRQFLETESLDSEIQPSLPKVLRALQEVDFPEVRVVILGQDPYPTPGHAMGLAFAVPNDVWPKPPSLINIYKEIASDLGIEMNPQERGTELSGWVRQGVLLLNTTLSVRARMPLSHQGKGWETFTDRVIEKLGERAETIVFLLWGNPARKKRTLIRGKNHVILESAHPSPLSAYRGFLGCRHFSQANAALIHSGVPPMDWARIQHY